MLERINEIFRSVVRPISTLSIVGVLCYGTLTKLIPQEAFLTIAILVVKWWFDERADERAKVRGTDAGQPTH